MRQCASKIEIQINENGGYNIIRANLCRDRLCPICEWRWAVKWRNDITMVMQDLLQQGVIGDDKTLWVLTLTVRNVPIAGLPEVLEQMAAAWNRLQKRAEFRRMSYGWTRTLKITRNNRTEQLHPYYQILIVARKGTACDEKTLTNMWNHALRVDYRPVVHMEEAYGVNEQGYKVPFGQACDKVSMIKGVVTSCLRPILDAAMLERLTDQQCQVVALAIQSHQFISSGGICKQSIKAMDSVEDR